MQHRRCSAAERAGYAAIEVCCPAGMLTKCTRDVDRVIRRRDAILKPVDFEERRAEAALRAWSWFEKESSRRSKPVTASNNTLFHCSAFATVTQGVTMHLACTELRCALWPLHCRRACFSIFRAPIQPRTRRLHHDRPYSTRFSKATGSDGDFGVET